MDPDIFQICIGIVILLVFLILIFVYLKRLALNRRYKERNVQFYLARLRIGAQQAELSFYLPTIVSLFITSFFSLRKQKRKEIINEKELENYCFTYIFYASSLEEINSATLNYILDKYIKDNLLETKQFYRFLQQYPKAMLALFERIYPGNDYVFIVELTGKKYSHVPRVLKLKLLNFSLT